MAHLYKKVKKGRKYYYIRETQRIYGKPTTINQVYLGTADRVESVLNGEDWKDQEGYSPKEFGSIFVLHELDQAVNLAGLVDEILPAKRKTKGPSIGELFFYAIMNRAIDPKSKRRLATWYETTDIQRLHPGRLESLSSQNFWNHWHRLDHAHLEKMVDTFFKKVHSLSPRGERRLLVDTAIFHGNAGSAGVEELEWGQETNLEKRPPRQIGLALVTDEADGVPVYYQNFPGHLPEEKFLDQHLQTLLTKVKSLGVNFREVTLVFKEGLNSQALRDRLQAQEGLHFLAAYPSSQTPELADIPLEEFRPIPCKTNRRLQEAGADADRLLYYEAGAPADAPEHRAIVIFDPKSCSRQKEELRERIYKVSRGLFDFQKKNGQNGSPEDAARDLEAQLNKLCENYQLSPEFFRLSFSPDHGRPTMNLELEPLRLEIAMRHLGKTILITDRRDWQGEEVCRAYLERCIIDPQPQEPHNPFPVSFLPQYHWTDSKLRIHVFVCVAALTYLALFCRRLNATGVLLRPKEAMEEMRELKSAIYWLAPEGKFRRLLAQVSDTQNAILRAMGFQIQEGKVVPVS